MIFPYGHEQTTVRRQPWVTFGIMAACAVAFLLSGRWDAGNAEDARVQDDATAAVEWYVQHPYLDLDPEFEKTFLSHPGDADFRNQLRLMAEAQAADRPRAPRAAEQEKLDDLTARAMQRLEDHTLNRWGLVPARRTPVAWVSHMFLHAGWLHLLGNMFILFLTGPFIEDVWGRPIFAGFYLASGLLAALFHVLSTPESTVPMIGASGAIAGLMGAFLMRYGRTKIKFFYIFGFVVRGTFRAPAWLMIPLWFVSQLWMGMLTKGLDVDAGVAHWAHIGGFVAGVGFAWLMASCRIEERFVHPKIESMLTLEVEENKDVVDALNVRESDPERAFRMLSLAVMNHPQNHDASAALWELALHLERTEEAAPLMLRSVSQQLRTGDRELALQQWVDVPTRAPGLKGDPRQLTRLGQELLAQEWDQDARVALRLALRSGGAGMDPALALVIARSARNVDPETARAAATQAAAGADPEARRQATALLSELPGASAAIPLSPR